ncbi:hypothetical protein NDU88_001518 [Pleurodeles waltl]|uniref:Uncharacterized protein n=1 Tax=Pleurodeles waltl TaxID=8319 RepID=A0AAV7KPP0_PLEWA|nr:hypothetical protein NDU88_001518 [Pleurodeles waltl]
MPNSGPPSSPHPENSARPEKRATVGPATFDTGCGFPRGPAGRRRDLPRGPAGKTPRPAAAQQDTAVRHLGRMPEKGSVGSNRSSRQMAERVRGAEGCLDQNISWYVPGTGGNREKMPSGEEREG